MLLNEYDNLQQLKRFYNKYPAIYTRMSEQDFLFVVCDYANDFLMENETVLLESAKLVLNECTN